MNKKNIRTEGSFVAHWPKRECFSCGKEVGEKEYRHTWSEELYNKTGGKEGRTYYCVPCGERISLEETKKEIREREEYNKEKEQNDRKTIADCLSTISSLTQKLEQENVAGTVENYKTIKNVEKSIKNLGNLEDSNIKRDIENLKKSCSDLINEYISPKDRKIGNSKRGVAIHAPCCTPKNVKLEKNDSEQYYYCDYCWETESPHFLKSLKSYHIDKLNKTMLDNGISATELNSSNYHSMLTVPDFVLTQIGIRDTYQKVEQDLQTLLKQKGINLDNQESRIKNQESRIKNQESRIKNQESRIKNQESRIKFPT